MAPHKAAAGPTAARVPPGILAVLLVLTLCRLPGRAAPGHHADTPFMGSVDHAAAVLGSLALAFDLWPFEGAGWLRAEEVRPNVRHVAPRRRED